MKTIQQKAEHYNLSLADAEQVIKLGKKEHELGVKLIKTLKTNDFKSFGNVFSKMLNNSIKGVK